MKVPRNDDNKMPSNQMEAQVLKIWDTSFENMKDTSRAVDIDITENCINIIEICKEVLSMNEKEKTLQELLKDILERKLSKHFTIVGISWNLE